jgi:hypothetical protein
MVNRQDGAAPYLVTPGAILGDDLNPSDRDYWVDDDMLREDDNGLLIPHYTVQETAKVFFARSADWLRWRSRPSLPKHPHGFFVLDGMPLEPKRTAAGARYYTLADVERMAHALAQNDALDGLTLTKIIMIIKWQARLYKVIE